MRKGRWKRSLVWGLAVGCGVLAALAVTWRLWVPAVARVALEGRGVHVRKISWVAEDRLKFEDVEFRQAGLEAHALSVTALRPWVWKKEQKRAGTNDAPIFVAIDGWKVIARTIPTTSNAATNQAAPIATRLRAFQARLDGFEAKCPRAQLLNGYIQKDGKEFRFGVVEWKNGQVTGDFTWPGLNEPADFKLTKTNLIMKQLALEIGSRINIEMAGDYMRVKGYARWMTNRVDFDLAFAAQGNVPAGGFVRSKGIAVPGRLFGAPEIEQVAGAVSMIFTNGQVKLRVGEIGAESAGASAPALSP